MSTPPRTVAPLPLAQLDFTIRYEGTQWALYKLDPLTRDRLYLGTYRHKAKAIEARDLHIKHFKP